MAKLRKKIEKVAGRHTSCIHCGELVFDRVLEECPRCGGRVTYFSDEDLGFLSRVADRPVLVASEDERK
jgi:predicted  nucleic acid-binding Zn-ribbon protein